MYSFLLLTFNANLSHLDGFKKVSFVEVRDSSGFLPILYKKRSSSNRLKNISNAVIVDSLVFDFLTEEYFGNKPYIFGKIYKVFSHYNS